MTDPSIMAPSLSMTDQQDDNERTAPTWLSKTLGGPVEPVMPTDWNGLAVVGEAPGATEVAYGVPFCGNSGRLLKKILDSAGIDKTRTALINVFSMQPVWSVDGEGKRRNNDISHFFTTDPYAGNERLKQYQGKYVLQGPDEDVRNLWRTLRLWKPKVIIACGSIASWALTGEDRIGDNPGRLAETKAVAAPVIVTYHPAYALHRNDEKAAALIAQHFAKARAILVEEEEKAKELVVPFF
jgi:uracil-DNA glycosylase